MTGAPLIADLLARWGFFVLVGFGWFRGDLGPRGITIFALLWLAGFVGLRAVFGGLLFAPYVAFLDIGLVFAIFKGDVRLM